MAVEYGGEWRSEVAAVEVRRGTEALRGRGSMKRGVGRWDCGGYRNSMAFDRVVSLRMVRCERGWHAVLINFEGARKRNLCWNRSIPIEG